MSQFGANVKLDTAALERFEADMRRGLDTTGDGAAGPWRILRMAFAARYSAFARRRFNNNARGGGDWPALALTTLRHKLQKGQKKPAGATRKTAIGRSGPGTADRSTLARDTKRGGVLVGFSGRSSSILIDTGVLQNALNIGAAGNNTEFIKGGVSFGFKDAAHPVKEGAKSSQSIAQIAAWHNFGRPPHLPQRIILPGPDSQTITGMQSDLNRAVALAFKQASGGAG